MSRKQRSESHPLVVVGAGVIGLAIAFRLARSGHAVVIVDRKDPGQEASFGNAGHIATEQVFPLASPSTMLRTPGLLLQRSGPLSIRQAYAMRIAPWLMRFAWAARPAAYRNGIQALSSLQTRAMQSTQQLCNDAGIGHLLHRRGHLIIAEHAQSLAKLEAQQALFAQHDIVSRPVSPGDLKARAPELTDRISGGLLIEGTGHVTNPYRLCSGLHESFQAAGGRTTRDELTEIATRSDGGFRLAMRGGTLDASRVIIAAGAWSGEFARQLGSPVPLDTERGYNVTADGWHPSFDVSIASLDRMTIMTPMDIGLRITGFVEFGGLALPPNPQLMHKLQCHLRELFPKSRLPELSNWMGFRPSLPDHLPVIGISPLHRNAIFAFGHQHLGLTLAGVTADIVDDLISGIEPAVDLRPFRADRF